jgi:ATP-binding protein involved in chromosome partitioning
VVSTPQEVALADARKGINMFRLDSLKVPILGIVENMAWFTPEELPDNKYLHLWKRRSEKFSRRNECFH